MAATKSYHTIIHNPNDIQRFAEIFAPHKQHLALCAYLTMRRKYYPALKQGTSIINRITVGGCPNYTLVQSTNGQQNPLDSNLITERTLPSNLFDGGVGIASNSNYNHHAMCDDGSRIQKDSNYNHHAMRDDGSSSRTATNFPQRWYQNILRLETPIGSYLDGDLVVPDEALAVYVILEPKDTIKALSKTLTQCVDRFSEGENLPNAYALYREEIPKSNIAGSRYRQIDLDTKEIDKVTMVHALLIKLAIPIILCVETRGGFHIVYSDTIDKETTRALYEFKQGTMFKKANVEGKMVADYWFSITSHPTIILPGTYQGGFPARIISLDDWLNQGKKE